MRLVGPLEPESRLLDVDFESGGRGSVTDLLLLPFLPLSVTVGEAGKNTEGNQRLVLLKETKTIYNMHSQADKAYAISINGNRHT